jgi:hypothetical protein
MEVAQSNIHSSLGCDERSGSSSNDMEGSPPDEPLLRMDNAELPGPSLAVTTGSEDTPAPHEPLFPPATQATVLITPATSTSPLPTPGLPLKQIADTVTTCLYTQFLLTTTAP